MERGPAIILIGFMGSGKSSVGRELATSTGLPRYDTDEMVVHRYGLPIAQIFARFGEDDFRAAEAEALSQLPSVAAIIVTGGGVVLRPENVTTLRQLGIVIHLLADEETLFARVSRRKSRPLLQTQDPRATLSEMLRVRAPHYEAAADRTVDTSELGHAEVAEQVLRHMEELRAHVG